MFAKILLGHFAGDYILQSKDMALRKSEKGGKGFAWCFIHCAIYTVAVCMFLWNFKWQTAALVFLTHFPIDRWSLAGKWLSMIRGRNFIEAWRSNENYREIDIAFSCLVYAMTDNTMHLILLYYLLGKII